MHAIPLKLRSQRGASMLLALLFLLICSMVAASILMAAAANAGKYRSNLEEHQTYLALSSAVSMLCDELNEAEYQGRYRYEVEEKYEDNEYGEPVLVDTLYYLDQLQGTYDGAFSTLLLDSFDRLFADAIEASPAVSGFDRITYQSRTAPLAYNLTLTPDTGTDLDGRPVAVTLEIKENYAMYLTAKLDNYTIRAELTPTESKPSLPHPLSEEGEKTTSPMKWKIGWITTGEEED